MIIVSYVVFMAQWISHIVKISTLATGYPAITTLMGFTVRWLGVFLHTVLPKGCAEVRVAPCAWRTSAPASVCRSCPVVSCGHRY